MLNREKQLMLDLLIEKYGTKDQQNVEVWQQLKNSDQRQDWQNHPSIRNLLEVEQKLDKKNESATKIKKTRKRILSVNRKHWSLAEMQLLVDYSSQWPVEDIAILMKRTKPAIYRMQGNLKYGKCSSQLIHKFRAGKDFSMLGNIYDRR